MIRGQRGPLPLGDLPAGERGSRETASAAGSPPPVPFVAERPAEGVVGWRPSRPDEEAALAAEYADYIRSPMGMAEVLTVPLGVVLGYVLVDLLVPSQDPLGLWPVSGVVLGAVLAAGILAILRLGSARRLEHDAEYKLSEGG